MEGEASLLLSIAQQPGLFATVVVAVAIIRQRGAAWSARIQQLLLGLVFGGAAAVAILEPVIVQPGVLYDAGSAFLALSAPFGGPLATLVAGAIAAVGRWLVLSGPAETVGLGSVLGVGLASVAFVAYVRYTGKDFAERQLVQLAALASAVSLLSRLLLPADAALIAFQRLALPLIFTNFVGIGVVGLILIAERRRRELQQENLRMATSLQTSEALHRLLAENTNDMIIRSDTSGRRLYVSPASLDLLGFEAHELIGTDPRDFLHPEDAGEFREKFDAVRRGHIERARSVHRFRRKDGSWNWVEANYRLVRSVTGEPQEIVSVVRDISERVGLERQLREQATTDGLTGLANRRAFDERLGLEWHRAIRESKSLALVIVDVDHFKLYNDQLGHAKGDDCLRRVAGILGDRRRGTDLVARFGGEEFCVILPNTDRDGAVFVAEAIRKRVEELRIAHPASPIGVLTVSAGTASSGPQPVGTAMDLFNGADKALYEAKRGGRNLVVAAPDPAH